MSEMSQPSKGIVPRFGSFKPKATLKHQAEDEPLPLVKSKNRDHNQRQNHDQGFDGRKTYRSPRRGDHQYYGDPKDYDSRNLKRDLQDRIPSPETARGEFEESDLFIIDRRGDKKNLEYGSLHRYDIPAHYRFGNGRVLGTPRDIRIDRETSTEKQVVLSSSHQAHNDRNLRPLASKSRLVESQGARLIVPAAPNEPALDADYIELRPSLKRKRSSEYPESILGGSGYRSIEGKAKESIMLDDADLEYLSDSDDSLAEDKSQRSATERNAALGKKAKEDPGNAEVWLALIEHQANVVLRDQDLSKLASSQKRALADIRLAIYNRALTHVAKDSSGHDQLVLGRLKEGSVVWEAPKLTAQWREALKDNPRSREVWTRHLDFVQTDHINSRFERTKGAYTSCLKMLKGTCNGARSESQAETASAYIYTLLRFTSFVRDAGYDEMAHAVWQIVFEYYFFRPPDMAAGTEMKSLEAFWESDVPRVGEEGAEGWTAFYSGTSNRKRTTQSASTTANAADEPQAGLVERESSFMNGFHLPASVYDEGVSDDPYCFVMFGDMKHDIIETFTIDLPKLGLMNALLCFMQLPPLRDCDPAMSHKIYWTDPFLCQPTSGRWFSPASSPADLIKHVPIWSDRLTVTSLFFDAFSHIGKSGSDKSSAAAMFMDYVLQQLIPAVPEDDTLAEYYLAFTVNWFPGKAVKRAKQVLKARPTSLRLSNAYALVEARLGHAEKAEDAWAAALGLTATWPDEKRRDAIVLTHSRMMTLLRSGQDDKALSYLVDPTKKLQREGLNIAPKLSAAERLKSVRRLDEGFLSMRFTKMPEHAALYADCQVWLSYLLEGHDLAAALGVQERYLSKLSPITETFTLELLHQARAELLRIHVQKRRPYKPAVIRAMLAKSIDLFPENSLFHEVQAEIGTLTRIDDRLRDAVQIDERIEDRGIVHWLYTIKKEVERCSMDGSGTTPNSVRALFSQALLNAGSQIKNSPLLWTLWLQFEQIVEEVHDGARSERVVMQHSGNRLRQLFYNGLRYLPWSKPWIIAGMRSLSQDSGSMGEMRQLFDEMAEKEMRVRTDFSGGETSI